MHYINQFDSLVGILHGKTDLMFFLLKKIVIENSPRSIHSRKERCGTPIPSAFQSGEVLGTTTTEKTIAERCVHCTITVPKNPGMS